MKAKGGPMKKLLLLAVVAAAGFVVATAHAQAVAPDAFPPVLEICGLLSRALTVVYEGKSNNGVVHIRVVGARPRLSEVRPALLGRVMHLIGDGQLLVTWLMADSFRERLIVAIAIYDDRQSRTAKEVAERFSTTPEQVEEAVKVYLDLFGKKVPAPLPEPPRKPLIRL